MQQLGKIVVLAGVIMILVGLALTFFGRIPYLGKLPGDIHIKRENFQFYFPLATSVVLSLLLSGILWLVGLLSRR